MRTAPPNDTWMLYRDEFDAIFSAIRKTGVDAVIAGGAVVDFEKASDIDVFVLGIENWVKCLGLANRLGGDLTIDAKPYDGDDKEESAFFRYGRCRPDWSTKDIDIIGFNVSTISALLDTFDLTIHAWALDTDYRLHSNADSTGVNEPIRVTRVCPKTAERLLKLSQRYHSITTLPF